MPLGFEQPQQQQQQQAPEQSFGFAQRDQGQGFPGVGLLQQLLGREGQPSLPEIPQVPISELIAQMNQAAGVDPERQSILRKLIEGRSDSPLTTAENKSPESNRSPSFNPFSIVSDLLAGPTKTGAE